MSRSSCFITLRLVRASSIWHMTVAVGLLWAGTNLRGFAAESGRFFTDSSTTAGVDITGSPIASGLPGRYSRGDTATSIDPVPAGGSQSLSRTETGFTGQANIPVSVNAQASRESISKALSAQPPSLIDSIPLPAAVGTAILAAGAAIFFAFRRPSGAMPRRRY